MPIIPVPGSEKFAYRPRPADELRALVGGHVRLHDVEAAAVDEVDPLSYEVIRHRLAAITEEMGEALKRMSGSVVVTDCNDFGNAILDECGNEVQVGLFNTQQCASMDMAVQWTLEHRGRNPGINEGDMFLTTDPWVGGGLHQNDASVSAPLFWEGELFCWTSSVAHQVDVGGVSPGSWTPRSEDVFWESTPLPPIKIVDRGELRSDVEDCYLRRSRVPKLVALDLRAKIGANNVAHQRISELISKYGPRTVKAVMRRVMDDAEARLRAKLADLPDGTWRAVAYQDQAREGDRGVYKIVCAVTKRRSDLTFDFTGTDPQVEGLINCTYGGIRGGIMPIVLTMLCGDIPWSPGGLYRCIDIITEEGTINNCSFPAAVSKAPVASAWASQNAIAECIAGMLDTHEVYRHSLMAVGCGTYDMVILAGVDQRETPFVTMLCDPMAGGMGARAEADGVDTGGLNCITMGRIADVEMNEFQFPLLYLWRREEPDSGGPGRYRGGLGASLAFVPHDTPVGGMHLVVSHEGKALPMCVGISGGYPGNTSHDAVARASSALQMLAEGRIPTSVAELGGELEIVPPEYETDLAGGDAYYTQWQAGGGYGDPLHREPARVARDVAEGRVTRASAHEIYGVAIAPDGMADEAATERRRVTLRKERIEAGAVA